MALTEPPTTVGIWSWNAAVNRTADGQESLPDPAENDSSDAPPAAMSSNNFFHVYFSRSRFAMETLLAAVTIVSNFFILTTIRIARQSNRLSVYNFLFTNLGVANILSCTMLWVTNNSLILFRRQVLRLVVLHDYCSLYVYMTAAIFVSSAFGVVTTVTMLGFSTAQYLAVCRPLRHLDLLRRRRLLNATVVTWILALGVGVVPFVAVYAVTYDRTCVMSVYRLVGRVVLYGLDACAVFDAIVYAVIVAQCARIWARMKVMRRDLVQQNYFSSDVRNKSKAVRTIFIMLATFNLLFVPYLIIYLLSLNVVTLKSYLNNEVLIYYMNTVPYVKCLADPIVYGLRMREFRVFALRVRSACRGCFNRCRGVSDGGLSAWVHEISGCRSGKTEILLLRRSQKDLSV